MPVSQAFHEAQAKAARELGNGALWRAHFLAARHALLAQRWSRTAAADLHQAMQPPPRPSRFVGVVQTFDPVALKARAVQSAAIAAFHAKRADELAEEAAGLAAQLQEQQSARQNAGPTAAPRAPASRTRAETQPGA